MSCMRSKSEGEANHDWLALTTAQWCDDFWPRLLPKKTKIIDRPLTLPKAYIEKEVTDVEFNLDNQKHVTAQKRPIQNPTPSKLEMNGSGAPQVFA